MPSGFRAPCGFEVRYCPIGLSCEHCGEGKLAALRARLARRSLRRRWYAFWAIVLGLTVGLAALAHAQNGLYTPQAIPLPPPAPLTYGGLMIEADSIVEMDTTTAFQYAPPVEYVGWWNETVACAKRVTKRRGWPSMAEYAFVTVDAPAFRIRGKGPFVGYTLVANRTILLPKRYFMNKALTSHEMLHAILYELGWRAFGHPEADPIFRACGLANQ